MARGGYARLAGGSAGKETGIERRDTTLYPMFVDVAERRCVVVGGGGVAARKARGLLESGARVLVVSPEVRPEIEASGVFESADRVTQLPLIECSVPSS